MRSPTDHQGETDGFDEETDRKNRAQNWTRHPPLSPYARIVSFLETLNAVSRELERARAKVVAGDGFSLPLQLLTDAATTIEKRISSNARRIKKLDAKSESTTALSPAEIKEQVGWLNEALELSILMVSIRREDKELDKVREALHAALPKVITAIKSLAKSS